MAFISILFKIPLTFQYRALALLPAFLHFNFIQNYILFFIRVSTHSARESLFIQSIFCFYQNQYFQSKSTFFHQAILFLSKSECNLNYSLLWLYSLKLCFVYILANIFSTAIILCLSHHSMKHPFIYFQLA